MIFPVKNPYRITTYFSAAHLGVDIAPIPAGSLGVACYAPERSKVIAVGNGKVEGNYIKLQGDSGMFYYMGHFARTFVIQGTYVSEGEVIATLGMTGLATGIHTHFECRRNANGGQIDPLTIKWTEGKDMEIGYNTANQIHQDLTNQDWAKASWESSAKGKNFSDTYTQVANSQARKDYLKYVKNLENRPSGNAPVGTYLKVNKADILEVK